MHIKMIAANYERKVNLGDFSSMTVGASSWADLDENDDPVACERQLFEFCREQVKVEVLRVTKAKGKQLVSISETEKMLGLEVKSREAETEAVWNEAQTESHLNRGDVGY